MSGLVVSNDFILPIIQYLVGPILTGIVVYLFTSNSNRKLEKNNTSRQLKLHKLRKIVKEFNEEMTRSVDYNYVLSKISEGDFSSVEGD